MVKGGESGKRSVMEGVENEWESDAVVREGEVKAWKYNRETTQRHNHYRVGSRASLYCCFPSSS